MSTRVVIAAALGSLLLATPALANRAGDAPIKAPRNLKTDHIAFTLLGGPWKQKVGQLASTPLFGRYALNTKLADGSVCNITADVLGKAQKHPPAVKGRTVRQGPNNEVVHFTSQGRHGAVQWWAGTVKGYDAAAAGVQRLPARLVSGGRRYLIYGVRMIHSAPRTGDKCAAATRRSGARIALQIVRTMQIADGPPVAKPPFSGA